MNKISAVYQIKNMVTGESYVGSSKDVYRRWKEHQRLSVWNRFQNSKLYKDMKEYGLENFMFVILTPVEPEYLRELEQEFIELLKPAYSQLRAYGIDVEKKKATKKACMKAYHKSEKYKAYNKAYSQTEKRKVYLKAHCKEFYDRLCSYNGETLTLRALTLRFRRSGIRHATSEAKKYLIQEQ